MFLIFLGDNIKVGITTKELDIIAYEYITSCGAYPSFLGYRGYPASICASIDDEVVHGNTVVKKDAGRRTNHQHRCGAYINGYHADAARTFAVGQCPRKNQKLIKVTEQSFFEGLKSFERRVKLGDLSSAIQNYMLKKRAFRSFGPLVGHGIGKQIRRPVGAKFWDAGEGLHKLSKNMTLAIEPMVTMGGYEVEFCPDGWTVKTKDVLPSAHYENTVVITANSGDFDALRGVDGKGRRQNW